MLCESEMDKSYGFKKLDQQAVAMFMEKIKTR